MPSGGVDDPDGADQLVSIVVCAAARTVPIEDVILVVYYPDKDSDSDEKLRLLAALAHTGTADEQTRVGRPDASSDRPTP
ncbi:hypothetical protein [Micromonospora sp. NPDC049102]|uniref:hypothetical protein n=1 Tax=Micromonospora sp. NPDC049102 TaxID=3364265 RepID=UPI00372468F5